MNYEKKKVSIPVIILGGVLSAVLGYYVNGAWHKGIEFTEFLENLNMELAYPFYDYYTESTPKAIVISLIIFTVVMFIYYTSMRNLMPGKEYGTARFSTAKELNRVLKATSKTGKQGNHRILSQNLRMNFDNRLTGFNNNILVIGGSGGGKTFRFVKPNLMQLNTSFFITDPKGEIYRSMAGFLSENGYEVKVLNLVNMKQSNGYNPFDYLRVSSDVPTLISNIISNTTPKGMSSSDPFWANAEGMFLQSLFYYVWLEVPKRHRNLRYVMKLLRMAEVKGKDEPSDLDMLMSDLAQTNPKGMDHPAVMLYQMSMRGAADTIRSIIISANARLAKLQNDEVLNLFEKDEMNFEQFGAGVNGDAQTKTALFCIIPDDDETYNFIVGMLYTQAFQTLYRTADEVYRGELPIHVTFMLDEFANVALPNDFTHLISTMRGRSISSIVIIQSLSQIKAMYEKHWEDIISNCATIIYLGGNEKSTHEYISGILGSTTIEKRSSGETKGRQGSSSHNYDVIQRELLKPDEVGRLPKNKLIIKIEGQYGYIDYKYNTLKHKKYKESQKAPELEAFVGSTGKNPGFEVLNPESIKYYEAVSKTEGRDVNIQKITLNELLVLSDVGLNEWMSEKNDLDKLIEVNSEADMSLPLAYENDTDGDTDEGIYKKELIRPQPKTSVKYDFSLAPTMLNIKKRLDEFEFTEEQKEEILKAVNENLPEEYILSYAYPENNTIKLASYRNRYKNGFKNHK